MNECKSSKGHYWRTFIERGTLKEMKRCVRCEATMDPSTPKPRDPTRISLKEWKAQEAQRLGITINAVQARLSRGKYSELPIVRSNSRTMEVLLIAPSSRAENPEPKSTSH